MKRACSICRCRPASFDDDVCDWCTKVLYADEDEPDRSVDLDAETDDPRHGQADSLNKLR